MNIKARPLLYAAGLGLVLQVAFNLVVNAVSFFAAPPDFTSTGTPGMFNISSVVGLAACLCLLIVDLGVGFFYAHMHSREATVTPGDGALGGAAAGVAARFISGLFGICLSLLLMPFLFRQMVDAGGLPPEAAGIMAGAGMIGGTVGGIIGLCVVLVLGAVLGAIGGAIGGSVLSRNEGLVY